MENRGNAKVFKAKVPLANMFGYVNNLRSMSQGRAQFTMQFDYYSQVPQNVAEEIKSGKQGHAPKPDYNTYKPGSYHDFDVGGDKPPVYIGNNNEKKK